MHDRQIIEQLISDNRLDRALEYLDHNVERDPGNALWWYLRGRLYWRLDKRANAITDYEEAAHLDPASPAVQALQYVRDIMDFYNPDLLNP